ncbi:hypothetical protein HAX54_014544, partial [Datura stramonium]|nr:hypothetical protein [Datura stramonium]
EVFRLLVMLSEKMERGVFRRLFGGFFGVHAVVRETAAKVSRRNSEAARVFRWAGVSGVRPNSERGEKGEEERAKEVAGFGGRRREGERIGGFQFGVSREERNPAVVLVFWLTVCDGEGKVRRATGGRR